ncbi:MAG: hypothetical protein ABSE68_01995 [Minisyncoccia bacterium]
MAKESTEAQKKESGEKKFITPILPESKGKSPPIQEKSQFLPPAKVIENTGCMSGN